MRVILLGPPGAGKGTQAELFVSTWKLEHISSGDIFRKQIKAKTPLGLKIKKYVDSGALVPDDIVVDLVVRKIDEVGKEKGFILDGFPRTLNQAKILQEQLSRLDLDIDKVFYLDASEEIIIKRLSGRRICKECAANYHLVNLPPKDEGVCDRCRGQLYQRQDDMPATVQNRLKVYQQQTAELIEYYRRQGILAAINSDLSKDETFALVRQIMQTVTN